MGEVGVDFIDTYRKFFEKLTSSVDPSDQLPVKVAGYNLVECEIPGAISDWSLQYLEERRCPPFLIAHLIRKVVEEVKVLTKKDPISCGFRAEIGDYLSLKLMQVCITKLVEVCSRYRDNAELSSLPSPHPLLPVTSCAIKNSRRSMEDRHIVIHDFHALFNIKGWGPASYYGVLDGHNGIDAAIYSVSHLHQYLAESSHYPVNPVKALHEACCKTDDMFTIKADKENLHGGTTAVVALLRHKERKLYVAWLGDSQAVLVKNGRPLQIVRPHKPDRPDERDRIEGMGGTVLYWGAWRVNGQLAVSRAIGDVEYKPYVTAEPDIEEISLDGTEDFLILGCDGLWDFVSEQQATDAVFKQLKENPEDLEAVSQRLVALSKEQSSQDNISVVVVFLADPAELAKRPPMETPLPMFNGQAHRAGGAFDDEDFGPETDVDTVDDVLLSPTAKALDDDDYERQRQQTEEFDDPASLGTNRDTPTPPANQARDGSGANVAESGGEESEEEWNYIPGDDKKNQAQRDEEDMNSQLNPNAAEFVPVSPKRLMDDTTIASSPARGFEKSLDNIQVPSEFEFNSEISHRPGDLECSNGSKYGEDLLNNFSVRQDDSKVFNPPQAYSKLTNEAIGNLEDNIQESAFVKSSALQDLEEKVTSAVLEKANIFGGSNEFSHNSTESANIFSNGDNMTASFIGKDLPLSPEADEFFVPGTPKSTTVEAPTSPTRDEVTSNVLQTELDSPVDDFFTDVHKSHDLNSSRDGLQEELISTQEKTSSSGFESESGADDIVPNVVSSEGCVFEQTKAVNSERFEFSSSNPFCTSTDYSNQFDMPNESQLKTLRTDFEAENLEDKFNSLSFVSPRRDADLSEVVPFDKLESPKDFSNFEKPPNANSSFLATELPKTFEMQNEHENVSPLISVATYNTNVNDITQELFSDDTHPKVEENSFSGERFNNESTEGQLETESKITQDEQECEQIHKQKDNDLAEASTTTLSSDSTNSVNKVLAVFDDIHLEEKGIETMEMLQKPCSNSDIEVETKEMELELESHIANSPTSGYLNTEDDGFEIVNKPEQPQNTVESDDLKLNSEPHDSQDFVITDCSLKKQEIPVESQNEMYHDMFSAVDQLKSAGGENVINSQNLIDTSSLHDPLSKTVEPEASKIVTYQTLTEVVEPQLTKTNTYLTEIGPKSGNPVLESSETSAIAKEKETNIEEEVTDPFKSGMPVVKGVTKSEPVQSTVVTETLITNIEEKSQIPSTEVQSSAGTPPPTPAPGLNDCQELHDTAKSNILVAAVAAAGLAAGSAIVAEKEVKKTKEVATKKSPVGTKKLPNAQAKTQTKPLTTKVSQPKSAKPTTAKVTGTGPTSATNKPVAAKLPATSAPTKKPITTTTQKTAAPPKPAATGIITSTAVKQTTSSKSVPKQLPITKTPSPRPSSKPTTPTIPKLPLVKSDTTKPLARPGAKYPLANKTLSPKLATDKVVEKKTMNGEVIKAEVPKRPAATTLKSSLTKSTSSAPKAQVKTTLSKPLPTSCKPKPPVGTTRPSTAPTGKTMSGKEAVKKQLSSAKPLLNGKSAPIKASGVIKKCDPKLSAKAETKPPPIKKPEELKKDEEKPMQIQEANVTTTNGFDNHSDDQNDLKINDLAPQTVDIIN